MDYANYPAPGLLIYLRTGRRWRKKRKKEKLRQRLGKIHYRTHPGHRRYRQIRRTIPPSNNTVLIHLPQTGQTCKYVACLEEPLPQ
tara:strand:- start:483 stop:740 length:258 start_codon:yes stop_codon:yes gene_type:complete